MGTDVTGTGVGADVFTCSGNIKDDANVPEGSTVFEDVLGCQISY